jgi:dolichyl-phosphate beta-glucosyltransferase
VNDGSTDKTKEVVRECKNKNIQIIDNNENKGKGYSIKQGFLTATKEWVLFTDADLSTPIEEFDTFLRYSDYDVMVGSRNLPDSLIVVKQPFLRSTLGKIFPFFVRLLVLPGIKDTQCGFKLFRKEAAQKIAELQTIDGFCFDVEQLVIAKKLGYSIKEVPISWHNDERSKIKIVKDSVRMFLDLVRIKLKYL